MPISMAYVESCFPAVPMPSDQQIAHAAIAHLRYHRGDSLTDYDLSIGIRVLSHTVKVLGALGPEFVLACSDVRSTVRAFEQFQSLRLEEG